MRSFLILTGLLTVLSVSASAAVPLIDDELETYRFRACDYWGRVESNFGFVYGCEFFPTQVEVPTADDTVRVFNQLIQKINDLEVRIQKLESSSARP